MIISLIEILEVALLVLSAIILHEYAHGWMAYRLGDPTAMLAGRLSLNPLKHIDLVGTILLPGALLALRLMGHETFIFGWAKPVPVNFSQLRHPKRDVIWVGLAGPAINILLAIFFAAILHSGVLRGSEDILTLAVFINLLLAAFNMVPIPPLDGSRLVIGLLPAPYDRMYARLERYGILIVFVLLYLGAFELIVMPVIQILGRLLGVEF
ncbi:MAG: hypothetical protein A2787_08405 [Omnitrophica WOR_2 bacterium RIFCSPHIGHO2_01_FULL_48_9]|nr:MAG: hypothetical protein A3D10_07915 [Omnitrophica WOR_2 bacterium RIFCSPHIGHO2_02_FULL_48_11]OGX33362.1 MAG: hypothetical protein A2787_08405 [Omnitrophica WOR_2 bacterium RIFCSPHIGHO2_01_FULL_48_9]